MKQIILLVVLSMSLQLVGQEMNHKYYKHLVFRESPYAAIKGRITISKERACKENHYKLSYNQVYKLVLVEYLFRNKQISRRRAGIMDGFRNIHSKTEISYQDNLEIRKFYNSDGVRCNNMMNVYKEVYTYDNNGKKIGVKFYDKNNNPINNTWNISEYIWQPIHKYDVIEKRKNVKGDYVTMRPYYHFVTTLYRFTKDGLLQSMRHIDENSNLINDFNDEKGIAIDKAQYDADLNLISFKFYNANNIATVGSFLDCAGGEITYDKNGNCIQYATIGLDGTLMLSRDKAYDVYKFDDFGNAIEMSHYGLEHEPVEYRGYNKTKFIYDAENPSKNGKIKRFQLKK